MSNHGEPQQIVSYDNRTKKYLYHKEILENLLSNEDISDCYISVISIAGAFRKGKSFLLSFLLRYLNEVYENGKNQNDWLGSKNVPLIGFSWRGGSRRETTGIWIWSKVFKYILPNGDKIGILLMDTQGTFDNKSTMKDNVTIFAFSSLCSSFQIFNLFDNIQESDLNHLELFAEYGKLAMDSSKEKAFQQLLFLIRDWRFNYEAPYGLKGGKQLLDEILRSDPDQSEELANVRANLKQSFEKLSCFLMPHPGNIATMKEFFDGKINDLSDEFVISLKELIPMILSDCNLQPKKIKNEKILAKHFLVLINSYWDVFSLDKLPTAKTIYEATAEANNFIAINDAIERYENTMNEFVADDTEILNIDEIMQAHTNVSMEATKLFTEKSALGNENQRIRFYMKLEENLRKLSALYLAQNENKRCNDFNQTILDLSEKLDVYRKENETQSDMINRIKVHINDVKHASDEEKRQLQQEIENLKNRPRVTCGGRRNNCIIQ